ncbi:hypothetical protein ACC704_38350, partial [Rhizobium johnstonii]
GLFRPGLCIRAQDVLRAGAAEEARRRVQRFKDDKLGTVDGDRIMIMGKDKDGKTDEIKDIVVEQGEMIKSANRGSSG